MLLSECFYYYSNSFLNFLKLLISHSPAIVLIFFLFIFLSALFFPRFFAVLPSLRLVPSSDYPTCSLPFIMDLVKLPVELVNNIGIYLTKGEVVRYGKYSKNLGTILKIVAIRRLMAMDKKNFKYLNFKSIVTVMKLIKLLNHSAVKHIPGYLTRYDENSVWLIKQPVIEKDHLVLIYCHGGGYFAQAGPGQLTPLLLAYLLLPEEKRSKLSILVLDYKLTCDGHPMPTQMLQLYDTYYRLLPEHRRIGIMGDSAGGNMAVGFTQFLKEKGAPKEDYPLVLALVSPWLDIYPDPDTLPPESSARVCSRGDIITIPKLNQEQIKQLFGNVDRHGLAWSPVSENPSMKDWADIPSFTDPRRKLLMIVGENETLRDECLLWGKVALNLEWHGHTYIDENLGPEYYEFEDKNTSVYMEPMGFHIGIFMFEKLVLDKIVKKKITSYTQLKDEQTFGLKKLTKFLQEAI